MASEEEINPNFANVLGYEQAITYCNNLIKEDDKSEEEKETVHTNPEGYEVLGTKKQRANDACFIAAKKGKNLRRKGKENKSASGPIKHNLGTIEAFSKLAVIKDEKWEAIIPPNTRDDVPAVLEVLKERLSKFKDLTK